MPYPREPVEPAGHVIPFPEPDPEPELPPRRRGPAGGRRHRLKAPVGWEPMQADWWESIAEHLEGSWPREAVLMDLRWWQSQERMGTRKRPGRPTLRARWGWSDRQVRNALKAEDEWCDPRQGGGGGQRADSERTAAERFEADNQPETDSERTASVPTRVRSQYTVHRSSSSRGGEGGVGGDQDTLLPEAAPPAPVGAPVEAKPRNAKEARWVAEVEPRILALGWLYDRADALAWVNRRSIDLERSAGVTRADMWQALQALLAKAEAGHVNVVNWKLTWANWAKKRVKFRAEKAAAPKPGGEAGALFDRLLAVAKFRRPTPELQDLTEQQRAAWVALGPNSQIQRAARSTSTFDLHALRRQFIAALTED